MKKIFLKEILFTVLFLCISNLIDAQGTLEWNVIPKSQAGYCRLMNNMIKGQIEKEVAGAGQLTSLWECNNLKGTILVTYNAPDCYTITCECIGFSTTNANFKSNDFQLNINALEQGSAFFSSNPSNEIENWINDASLKVQTFKSSEFPFPTTGDQAFDDGYKNLTPFNSPEYEDGVPVNWNFFGSMKNDSPAEDPLITEENIDFAADLITSLIPTTTPKGLIATGIIRAGAEGGKCALIISNGGSCSVSGMAINTVKNTAIDAAFGFAGKHIGNSGKATKNSGKLVKNRLSASKIKSPKPNIIKSSSKYIKTGKFGTSNGKIISGRTIVSNPVSPMRQAALGQLQLEYKPLKPLGLGSTGRTSPKNISEQIVMKNIQENPSLGKVIMNSESMKDSRWTGWKKIQYVEVSKYNKKVVIHYVGKFDKTGKLIAVDDFKFVD